MPHHLMICIAFVLVTPLSFAATVDEDGDNEYTIRPSHFPTDAPRFEDYPAKEYLGQSAAPDLRGDPTSRMYQTKLKEWSRVKPNFAGHFILATWGCGTDCTQISIIDARTGKVFYPRGATTNVAVNVHDSLLAPSTNVSEAWHGAGALQYRGNSRLLVLIGMPEERAENRGIPFYVWTGTKLKRIRFIPVTENH